MKLIYHYLVMAFKLPVHVDVPNYNKWEYYQSLVSVKDNITYSTTPNNLYPHKYITEEYQQAKSNFKQVNDISMHKKFHPATYVNQERQIVEAVRRMTQYCEN